MPVKKRKTKSNKSTLDLKIKFLSDGLSKCLITQSRYDWRANIVIAISGLIFIYSLTNLFDSYKKGTIGFLVISVSCLIAIALGLYSLKTPEILKRKELKESLLHPTIIRKYTRATIAKKFNALLADPDKIINEYITEIYNISVNSIAFKKRFSRYSANTLVIGLVVGLVLFFFLP